MSKVIPVPFAKERAQLIDPLVDAAVHVPPKAGGILIRHVGFEGGMREAHG